MPCSRAFSRSSIEGSFTLASAHVDTLSWNRSGVSGSSQSSLYKSASSILPRRWEISILLFMAAITIGLSHILVPKENLPMRNTPERKTATTCRTAWIQVAPCLELATSTASRHGPTNATSRAHLLADRINTSSIIVGDDRFAFP